MTLRLLLAQLTLFLGVAAVLAPVTVFADARSIGLNEEIKQAASEIETLTYQLAQAGDSPSIAVMQTRLQDLEEQIRRLTGRMERLEFEEGKLNTRIDRLVGDVDTRLSALESKASEQASIAQSTPRVLIDPQSPQTSESLPTPRPTQQVDTQSTDATSEGEPEQVLGTIPRDAVLGVPQPSSRQSTAGTVTTRGSGDPETRYVAALELLQTADLGSAEVAFTRFLDDHPDSERAPDAAFWLGETYFARGDYPTAAATFARNYRAYGADSPKAPDNLLKLGMSLAQMDDNERACQSFDQFSQRYPDASASLRQAVEREKSRAGCG